MMESFPFRDGPQGRQDGTLILAETIAELPLDRFEATPLWEDDEARYYRCHDMPGRGMLKTPGADRPSTEGLRRFAREAQLADRLDARWALVPNRMARYPGGIALFYPEGDVVPLLHQMQGKLDVGQVLRWAVALARALDGVHGAHLVFKNLSPSRILWNPTTESVKLTGFGLAEFLTGQPGAGDPVAMAGPLPYMSPEQTGRMNRAVDHRSDLYSLGALLYQLLTGTLPCRGKDPMEWVHCHLAKLPVPPVELAPEVPRILSRMVMKLLAKAPEDRYQTARGLGADLERCLAAWRANGRIDAFPLATDDGSDQLLVPQRLYGREAALAILQGAYARTVGPGTTAFALVSGYSGIGKTALVHELQRLVIRDRGFFLEGKFDQFHRDIPYFTLIQAFEPLVRQLLAGSDVELARWRKRIQEAVGLHGQLIVEVIPPIELIMGRQPEVVERPPAEARHRFYLTLQRFIAAFAAPEHPLVLLLDDLQWADPASLALVQALVVDPATHHLLLIGAYRDNEVPISHPLMLAIEAMRRAGATLEPIHLGPLSREDLGALVADTLRVEPAEAAPLAALVHRKTLGNPFFVWQFLRALWQDQMLVFDRARGRWVWDLERVEARGITDNVVALLVTRLQRLPPDTREMVQVAAAVGAQVESAILQQVRAVPEEEVERQLEPALQEGLILRRGDAYRFLHDRVQQAAYEQVPVADRPALHVKIGSLMLAHTPPEGLAERAFDLATQFNMGLSLVQRPEERFQVASLNLAAGRRAKAAAAYQAALGYLEAGQSLIRPEEWAERYELAHALELEAAQVQWLGGAAAAALQTLDALLRRAQPWRDRAEAYQVRAEVHQTLGEQPKAVGDALEALHLYGVDLPAHPSWDQVLAEYEGIWALLGERPIEDILDLPLMTDFDQRRAMDILAALYAPAYFTDVHLLFLVTCRMVAMALRHGITGSATVGLAGFGRLLGPTFDRYEEAYRVGKVAYELVARHGYLPFKARVTDLYGISTTFWLHHVDEGLAYARQGVDEAAATGDLTYACYACMHVVRYMLVRGDPLEAVADEAERRLDFVQRARFDEVADVLRAMQRFVRVLRGEPGTVPLAGLPDEAEFGAMLQGTRSGFANAWHACMRLEAAVIARDLAGARLASQDANRLLEGYTTQLSYPEFCYYDALALAMVLPGPEPAEPALRKLKAREARLGVWAGSGPDNFLGQHALVAAEVARVEGRDMEAMRLYDQAIAAAHKNGFVSDLALANELAASFYRDRGFTTIAEAYLREAYEHYQRWGAEAKARQLGALHPWLRGPAPGDARAVPMDIMALLKASQAISRELDLGRLIEALLRLMLEIGGADRGVLLLARDEALEPGGEAVVMGEQLEVRLWPQIPPSFLPGTLINYVRRTKEPVVLANPAERHPFRADPYLLRGTAKSVLCLPIVKQQNLIGLLYMENHLTSHAFMASRIAVLDLLASQAAISLENVRLFGERRRAEEALRLLNVQLEQRVRERTTQLEAANQELEAFSYSVSHDLRAPLRTVNGFSQMLLDAHAGRLDAKGLEYLRWIRSSGARMERLIDDLLQLSRLTRAPIEREPVDLGALARVVVDRLRQREPARKVELSVEDGLVVHGDPRLLELALENLLGNAWKYTSKHPTAQIVVGSMLENGRRTYFVRDDGAGFDMDYAAKLFRPFQRLHTSEEFEGTGIGLATVQRVLHRHGGRIWAEGAVEAGATFYFQLGEEA